MAFNEIGRSVEAELDGTRFDIEEFASCVDAGRYDDAVAVATAEATALLAEFGARPIGVPTFFINGELWRVGLQTIDAFRAEVERIRTATAKGK